MESNLERILYLAVGILLFAMAITTFYSSYSQYQGYIELSDEIKEESTILYDNSSYEKVYHTGAVVLHRILEIKNQEELTGMTAIYSADEVPNIIPNIYVDGIQALHVSSESIEPEGLYEVTYSTDTTGTVKEIIYNYISD